MGCCLEKYVNVLEKICEYLLIFILSFDILFERKIGLKFKGQHNNIIFEACKRAFFSEKII